MYGPTIGTLNVLLLQNSTRSSPIWTLSSNQGNMWRIAQVTLNSPVDFSVSVCKTSAYWKSQICLFSNNLQVHFIALITVL